MRHLDEVVRFEEEVVRDSISFCRLKKQSAMGFVCRWVLS